jgi:hypothetical protein
METVLIEAIDDYYEKLQELFEDEKEKTDELGVLLKQTKASLRRKPEPFGKKFEELIHFHAKNHEKARSVFEILMRIRDLIERPEFFPDAIDSTLSQTFRLNTAELLGNLLIQFKEYEVAFEDREVTAVKESTKAIFGAFTSDGNDTIENLEFMATEMIGSVSLFASVMQKCVDFFAGNGNRKLLDKVLELVEVAKDKVLSHKKNRWPKPAFSLPLRTYGFLPTTKSMSLGKLVEWLDRGQRSLPKTNDADKFLREYMESSGIGFIVTKKILDGPVEYSSSVLGKKLESGGITKKIVDEFELIRQLEASKWNFDSKIYCNAKCERFFVLETLDGVNFRTMAPWLKGRMDLPFSRVRDLIRGVQRKVYPDRATNYHSLCEKAALENMFLRRKLGDEPDYVIDSQRLQSEVFLRLMKFVQKETNKMKKYGDREMNKLVHAAEMREIFETTMIEFYSDGAKNTDIREYDAGKAGYGELLGTYLSELRRVVSRFMKELHDGYNRKPIDWSKIGEKRAKDVVLKKMEDLVMGVLGVLISDRSNLYTVLNHKYFLLNYR